MNPSSADQDGKDRDQASSDVDRLLRQALDGDSVATQVTVERLIQTAIAEPTSAATPSVAPPSTWRWATVALGAAAVAAVLIFNPLNPPASDSAANPRVSEVRGSEGSVSDASVSETPRSRSVALEITNRNGAVTVTATAGSKVVFLPPVSPTTIPLLGGAS